MLQLLLSQSIIILADPKLSGTIQKKCYCTLNSKIMPMCLCGD